MGAGIGVLSWIAFLLSDKPIGCSTAFARTSGMILRLFAGKKVSRNAYFRSVKPEVDWQWMLVVGIIIGAFISAHLSGEFRITWTPQRWFMRYGPEALPRFVVALIGGTIMGIGARWAGGCTSGHGISGTLQLAVSGWIAAACFFIGGIATAMLLFNFVLA